MNMLRSSNVVSLLKRKSDLNFSAIAQVEAYWEALRNGRPMPGRHEVDPRGISQALEYAFILERIAPGVARFRLAGMHLTDLMGMEVRGMPLTAMFVPDSRARLSEALEAVFESPEVVKITLRGERGIGRGALEAQLLLAPLKSDLGDVNRVLGCFQSKGAIGRQPRRFEATEYFSRKILTDGQGVEGGYVREEPRKAPSKVPPGFAEAKAAYDARVRERAALEKAGQSPFTRPDVVPNQTQAGLSPQPVGPADRRPAASASSFTAPAPTGGQVSDDLRTAARLRADALRAQLGAHINAVGGTGAIRPIGGAGKTLRSMGNSESRKPFLHLVKSDKE